MADAGRRRCRAAVVLALLLPGIAAAQTRSPAGPPPDSLGLAPGVRVRIALSGMRELRFAAVIDSVLPQAFVVDTAAHTPGLPFMARGPELLPQYRLMRVRYDEIDRMDVSRGTSRLRGALLWGAVGGLAGGLLTGLNDEGGFGPGQEDDGSFASAALPGLALGAILGGALGYFTGRERWAPAGWP